MHRIVKQKWNKKIRRLKKFKRKNPLFTNFANKEIKVIHGILNFKL